MKTIKERSKTHFIYKWYLYVFLLIVFIVLDILIISYIIKPKSNEKVTIFVGSSKVNTELLEDKIYSLNDNNLKEVNILDYSPDDYYFGVSLTSAGVVNTDLIIVPLDKINESFAAQYCKRIDEMEFDINYDFEFISYSSINYGIKVYSKDLNISLFDKYITYNEEENEYLEYGLFFNKDSVNLKDLFKETNNKYSNNATKVFYGLMEEENE
ncbi:MAG: hypothetical protein PUF99_05815 [Bacilli bacterium]|nr:hypothetical protein [Bacilli bacterium]